DVAKALNHDACVFGSETEALQCLRGDDHAAAPGCFRPTQRATELERLAGDDRRYGVALVHGIGVHDPGHGLFVRVHVGRGNVALRTDELADFSGVSASDAFELTFAQQFGLADDAALTTTEGNVDHGAFP